MRNFVPLPYRQVSVQEVDFELTEGTIRERLLGREAYRRTAYVVLCREGQQAIAAVAKASEEPLFSPITGVSLLAPVERCTWAADPALDVGNRSALAAKARELGLGPEDTLIVEGRYGHVNFIHRPRPLTVRIVDVIPPEPPKLFDQAQRVLSYADLPPITLEPEFIDLRALAASRPDAAAYLFPCRASGLVGPGPTFYLDRRPAQRHDWVLIGCERSRQIHQHFYGDEPPNVEMCPRIVSPADGGPTLRKCCLLETDIEVVGQTATVPWGADLSHVEAALRALATIEERNEG
jgi:hypothetical protein